MKSIPDRTFRVSWIAVRSQNTHEAVPHVGKQYQVKYSAHFWCVGDGAYNPLVY